MSLIGRWLDARTERARAREIAEEPRLEWKPGARELLEEAGFQGHWRLAGGKAHGKWADGSTVALDAEVFADRFMVRDEDGVR